MILFWWKNGKIEWEYRKNGYVKRLSEPELNFERVNASAEFIEISCLICIFLFEFGVLLMCYLFNASRDKHILSGDTDERFNLCKICSPKKKLKVSNGD